LLFIKKPRLKSDRYHGWPLLAHRFSAEPPMKLSRLYRPHDRRFWLMILLNVLSAILAWVLRTYPLVPLASVVVAIFALGNAALGIFIAYDLIRDDAGEHQDRT
jgi:hypothetical protein